MRILTTTVIIRFPSASFFLSKFAVFSQQHGYTLIKGTIIALKGLSIAIIKNYILSPRSEKLNATNLAVISIILEAICEKTDIQFLLAGPKTFSCSILLCSVPLRLF